MLQVWLLSAKEGSEPRQSRRLWGMMSRCLGDLGGDLVKLSHRSSLAAEAGCLWVGRQGFPFEAGQACCLPSLTLGIPGCNM